MWARKVIWSPVEIDYLKVNRDLPVNQLSLSLAKTRNAIAVKLREIDGRPYKQQGKKNKFSRIGKRKDLGIFLRSSWESNFCRYLKHHNQSFMYEPKVFLFENVKHGTVSYVPDFRVESPSGDYNWIEIKGMLKSSDKTRIRRFKKLYPEDFVRLKAVCNPNTAAEKFFLEMNVPILAHYRSLDKQYKDVIPHWE